MILSLQFAIVSADDFSKPLDSRWRIEQEAPALIASQNGTLEIDTPKGLTLWLNQWISGPIQIDFDAIAVKEKGPNDRVSDLNCFWMAHENDGSAPKVRHGAFKEYDTLRTYYVGIGGNNNTTTRFRRYIGESGNRPLDPQHDLRDPAVLLEPNKTIHICIVSNGRIVRFYRNDRLLFDFQDTTPYTGGFFGFRTTSSHLKMSHFQISRVVGLSK